VRAEALLRLPKCDDALAREMVLGVLTSGEISDLAINHRMVMQIIGYLKRHDIEALKAVKAKPRWKQAEINAALGLPAPPPSEEDLRREREELQTE
jgi:hypothetical protein